MVIIGDSAVIIPFTIFDPTSVVANLCKVRV